MTQSALARVLVTNLRSANTRVHHVQWVRLHPSRLRGRWRQVLRAMPVLRRKLAADPFHLRLDLHLARVHVHAIREGQILVNDIASPVPVPHANEWLDAFWHGGARVVLLRERVVQRKALHALSVAARRERGRAGEAKELRAGGGARRLVALVNLHVHSLRRVLDALDESVTLAISKVTRINQQVVVAFPAERVQLARRYRGQQRVEQVRQAVECTLGVRQRQRVDARAERPDESHRSHAEQANEQHEAASCLVHRLERVAVHVLDRFRQVLRRREGSLAHGVHRLEAPAAHPQRFRRDRRSETLVHGGEDEHLALHAIRRRSRRVRVEARTVAVEFGDALGVVGIVRGRLAPARRLLEVLARLQALEQVCRAVVLEPERVRQLNLAVRVDAHVQRAFRVRRSLA
mmetsp:Transcript_9999/g.22655  ORF Transcript_9999/g.22655 Transcript_9999/m.22655 type:complete len:405 (+) Transcript_9999:117-1331(+)